MVAPCCLVFFVAGGELSSCLSDHVLWHSGHVSLYTPDREYLSCARSLCVSRLANVYVVRNVILRSILLKMFVMYEVSLPMFVKQAHFCVVWVVICLSGLGVGVCAILLERGYCVGCSVLCLVLVNILFAVGCRIRAHCTGI